MNSRIWQPGARSAGELKERGGGVVDREKRVEREETKEKPLSKRKKKKSKEQHRSLSLVLALLARVFFLARSSLLKPECL